MREVGEEEQRKNSKYGRNKTREEILQENSLVALKSQGISKVNRT